MIGMQVVGFDSHGNTSNTCIVTGIQSIGSIQSNIIPGYTSGFSTAGGYVPQILLGLNDSSGGGGYNANDNGGDSGTYGYPGGSTPNVIPFGSAGGGGFAAAGQDATAGKVDLVLNCQQLSDLHLLV